MADLTAAWEKVRLEDVDTEGADRAFA